MMHTYRFQFRRGNREEFHQIVECAYTAEDALTQFRVNVIDNPNNQVCLGSSVWVSCIKLWGMETLPDGSSAP